MTLKNFHYINDVSNWFKLLNDREAEASIFNNNSPKINSENIFIKTIKNEKV